MKYTTEPHTLKRAYVFCYTISLQTYIWLIFLVPAINDICIFPTQTSQTMWSNIDYQDTGLCPIWTNRISKINLYSLLPKLYAQ